VAEITPATPARRDLVVLPARRLLAVDAGAHSLKVILAEEIFGRFRVLRQECFELRGGGAQSDEEALHRVQGLIREMGDSPVALALPHYHALSQVVDLPGTPPGEVRYAIEEEVRKLSGLGESQIVHDYSSLAPFGHETNPFWVTLCQAAEVQRCIARCGLGHLDLCEVTTSANALVAAFQAARPDSGPVVLLDLGATGTVIAILLQGQPVYTATFALGADALLETENPSSDTEGPVAVPEAFLQRWMLELQRALGEWLREHPVLALAAGDVDYYLAGALAETPGLKERLSELSGLRFHAWPENESGGSHPSRFAVAYGAALHALGRAAHPASLLPDEVRVYWNRHHATQVLHSILFFLLVVLVIMFGFGTWQKTGLLLDKRRMLRQTQAALDRAQQTQTIQRGLASDYAAVQPFLASQYQSVQTLQTLALLQQARSNRSFWYVLVADRESYYSTPLPPQTNGPPAAETPAPPPAEIGRSAFIAELSVPEQGDARRSTLNHLVAELRESPLFRNVDSLAEDRRRALADPAVVLPESHSALVLELADNPFEQPLLVSPRQAGAAGAGVDTRAASLRAPGPVSSRQSNGPNRSD
jgi:hypothetical protein